MSDLLYFTLGGISSFMLINTFKIILDNDYIIYSDEIKEYEPDSYSYSDSDSEVIINYKSVSCQTEDVFTDIDLKAGETSSISSSEADYEIYKNLLRDL
jgi:hypothetical protein